MKTLWKWAAFAVSMLLAILVLFAVQASAQAAKPVEALNEVPVHGRGADK
jgi:bacteriorhodopsin